MMVLDNWCDLKRDHRSESLSTRRRFCCVAEDVLASKSMVSSYMYSDSQMKSTMIEFFS